jgi:glutathionyl-hydroquinone reductase
MAILINGVWHDELDYLSGDESGHFQRQESRFRHWIEPDPLARFPAQAGRYRLYASLACPWAHRTLIVRKLKGLESSIPVTVVDPIMGPRSWHFSDASGCDPDPALGAKWLYELYLASDPAFTGVPTVPLLWDTQCGTIVNNESSEILRMLNSAFDTVGARSELDLYPLHLREAIDAVNQMVYDNINNGVYCAGFATSQTAYEEAYDALFNMLDELEHRLSRRRYLCGNTLTEADWRLFTTLIRFDAVYHGHFKCNRQRLTDFPNLWAWTRELYQWPGIAGTVDFDHIKRHYYMSHRQINPTGIVPKGPELALDAPHGREACQLA